MLRRTLLQTLAAIVVAPRAQAAQLAQSAAAPPALGEPEIATLRAIAEVVIPQSAGPDARTTAVDAFVGWHRNYKQGADRGHGYGSSTLSAATGPPPSARYPAQFSALDAAARLEGVASFAALRLDQRRRLIEASLDAQPRVTRLPARPTGANLIADFMGLYFNSPEAWDLCYGVEIGRDRCRTLDGSDQPPSPLPSRGR